MNRSERDLKRRIEELEKALRLAENNASALKGQLDSTMNELATAKGNNV